MKLPALLLQLCDVQSFITDHQDSFQLVIKQLIPPYLSGGNDGHQVLQSQHSD